MKAQFFLALAAITVSGSLALATNASCTLTVNGVSKEASKTLRDDGSGGLITSNTDGTPQIGKFVCYGSISLLSGKTTSYRLYSAELDQKSGKEITISRTNGTTGLSDGQTAVTVEGLSKSGDQISCSCRITN